MFNAEKHAAFHQAAYGNMEGRNRTVYDHPHSVMVHPVYSVLKDKSSSIAGLFLIALPWDGLIQRLVTDGSVGIYAVLSNSCGQSYTYQLKKNNVSFD